MSTWPLANLQFVAFDTLLGLSVLESAGVIHNDIKADNLVWVRSAGMEVIKIIDFGCARPEGGEAPGPRSRWPPEVLLGGPATHKLDIWSLAVTVRELAGWKIKANTHEAVMAQALSICQPGAVDEVLGEGWQLSEKAGLGQLLNMALVRDPSMRASAAQLLQLMQQTP